MAAIALWQFVDDGKVSAFVRNAIQFGAIAMEHDIGLDVQVIDWVCAHSCNLTRQRYRFLFVVCGLVGIDGKCIERLHIDIVGLRIVVYIHQLCISLVFIYINGIVIGAWYLWCSCR